MAMEDIMEGPADLKWHNYVEKWEVVGKVLLVKAAAWGPAV